MDPNTVGFAVSVIGAMVSIIGTLISIVGVAITVGTFLWSTLQLRNGVKTAFQYDVRKTINRIERNKETFKHTDPEAYKELFDVQDELETMSKKFLAMFGVK